MIFLIMSTPRCCATPFAFRAPGFFSMAALFDASVDPPAASIARFDLDAALWHSAESAGVDARQQVTVQSVGGSGPFRIVTTGGEFEAGALVNASGRWSNLNLPLRRKMEYAARNGSG